MKIRILSLYEAKRNVGVTILLFAIIVTIAIGMEVTSIHSENGNIKDSFYKSVNYEPSKDLLSFTIPKTIPDGYRFYLHVSGRMFMGDKSKGMSFHAFDNESLNYTWVNGKIYTYPLNSAYLDFITIDFGLQNICNKELLYTYTIHISSDGTKNIDKVN